MKSSPINDIRIKTFGALRTWLGGFRDGKINLLFLVGGPGRGKSRMVKAALEGISHLFIEGHATPLKTYIDLFHHRDEPVVIDDEDSFHAEPLKIGLMKCLCSTEPVKQLRWETTSRILEDTKVPQDFKTASKVIVITNHARAVNPQIAALFDRGNVLSFDPSPQEIHSQVETWFDDHEILAFFARWLSILPDPSMRLYVKAKEMKEIGLDWRAVLMGLWKAKRLWLIESVHADKSLKTEEERAAAFEARGGGKRATYYRHLKRWRYTLGELTTPTLRTPAIQGP